MPFGDDATHHPIHHGYICLYSNVKIIIVNMYKNVHMLNVYNYVHGVVPLIYLQPRSVLVYKLCKTRVQRVLVEEAVASQRGSGEALEGGVL